MIKVKNKKELADIWCGMTVEPETYYELETFELHRWQNDSKVLTDIASGNLLLNNGTIDILDIATAINALKGIINNPVDSLGIPLVKNFPFSDASGFRFRGASFSGVGVAGNTTDIDYLIPAERWINGGSLLLKNHTFGDYYTFQVVDKDNIMGYGVGVVLDEFIDCYYVDDEHSSQQQLMLAYPAKLYAGLYLRLKYTSVGLNNVTIKCNMFLHWKST